MNTFGNDKKKLNESENENEEVEEVHHENHSNKGSPNNIESNESLLFKNITKVDTKKQTVNFGVIDNVDLDERDGSAESKNNGRNFNREDGVRMNDIGLNNIMRKLEKIDKDCETMKMKVVRIDDIEQRMQKAEKKMDGIEGKLDMILFQVTQKRVQTPDIALAKSYGRVGVKTPTRESQKKIC